MRQDQPWPGGGRREKKNYLKKKITHSVWDLWPWKALSIFFSCPSLFWIFSLAFVGYCDSPLLLYNEWMVLLQTETYRQKKKSHHDFLVYASWHWALPSAVNHQDYQHQSAQPLLVLLFPGVKNGLLSCLSLLVLDNMYKDLDFPITLSSQYLKNKKGNNNKKKPSSFSY